MSTVLCRYGVSRNRDDVKSSFVAWSFVCRPVEASRSDVPSLCQCPPWPVDVVADWQRLGTRRGRSVAGTVIADCFH